MLRGVHQQLGPALGAAAEGKWTNPILQAMMMIVMVKMVMIVMMMLTIVTITNLVEVMKIMMLPGLGTVAPCSARRSGSSFAVRPWRPLG